MTSLLKEAPIWADVKWAVCSYDTMPDTHKVFTTWSYLQNIFDDPLFIMVAGLQVFHIKFEQIQRSGTCRMDRISQKKQKKKLTQQGQRSQQTTTRMQNNENLKLILNYWGKKPYASLPCCGSYSIYILSCVCFISVFMSCAVSACHIHVLQSIQLVRTCEATCAVACCPTRLAQHVGKADVWAQGRVHLHPGRHGVKLTVVVELVQEFLSENNKIWIQDGNWSLNFLQIEMVLFCDLDLDYY